MKLFKVDDIYTLMDGDKMIASSDSDFQNDYEVMKLSKQNCDEIFGVVNIDKLAKKEAEKLHDKDKHDDWDIYNSLIYEDTQLIKIGFNKAIELNEKTFKKLDEKLDSMVQAAQQLFKKEAIEVVEMFVENLKVNIQKIQQPKEIEVEIEMVKEVGTKLHDDGREFFMVEGTLPKLDANDCVVLIKK